MVLGPQDSSFKTVYIFLPHNSLSYRLQSTHVIFDTFLYFDNLNETKYSVWVLYRRSFTIRPRVEGTGIGSGN